MKKNKQILYIEPIGGLANRMRVIASAFKLKKEFDCEIFCIWNENSELNAPFDKLFGHIEGLNIISKSKKMKKLISTFSAKSSWRTKSIFRLLVKIYNKRFGFDFSIHERDVRSERNIVYDILKNNKDVAIYVCTCHPFANWDTEDLNFNPVKEIIEKIEFIHKQFSQYSEVIGLHIRRTDNVTAIEHSPIELFVCEIENKIRENNNVGFFLATDDKDIEYLLQKLYPNKIIVEQKNLRRDSLEGIQDAIVDMFSLSKTSMIYGSYWSSFSSMAGKISGVECVLLRK